eukprot:m.128662 g.128662  ORF g.128662 m.128662 type:complete len:420 (+) comp29350_c0_seq1:478-1737(+)
MADVVRETSIRRRKPTEDDKPPSSDQPATDEEDISELPYAEHKTRFVAYLCWLTFGWFGLHHWYLGRDDQALLWSTTLGGYLVGWLRDLWRMGDYVAQANFETSFIRIEKIKREATKTPPWLMNSAVIPAICLFAPYFRFILCHTISLYEEDRVEYIQVYLILLGSLGTAYTVYCIGNMPFGNSGSFLNAFIGAFVGEAIEAYFHNAQEASDDDDEDGPKGILHKGFFGVCLSTMVFLYFLKYRTLSAQKKLRKSRNRRGSCKSFVKLQTKVFIFWAIVAVAMHQNFEFEDNNNPGESIRMKDCLKNIYNSPIWAQLGTELYQLYEKYQENPEAFWSSVSDAFDVDGVKKAYRDLELEQDASQEEIKKAARKFQKIYHPDRCKLPADECTEKFQGVQRAYEVLSDRVKNKPSKGRRRQN